MTLIAILFPWLSFFLRGRLLTGLLCLLLQCTLIGWIPAAIWAVIDLQNARADRRMRRMMRGMRLFVEHTQEIRPNFFPHHNLSLTLCGEKACIRHRTHFAEGSTRACARLCRMFQNRRIARLQGRTRAQRWNHLLGLPPLGLYAEYWLCLVEGQPQICLNPLP